MAKTKARLTVTIDQETQQRLDEFSKATLVAKSKLVNQALLDYMDKYNYLDTGATTMADDGRGDAHGNFY